MGMVIHDDFWEAAKAMPKAQRAQFVYAVVAYGMEGEEPEGSPPWLPTFLVVRGRIEMGGRASERGRSMARARWGKRTGMRLDDGASAQECRDAGQTPDAGARNDAREDAQAYARAYAQAHAQACAQACADASDVTDAEVEDEDEITPLKPPYARIVGRLNERAGTSFRASSRRTREKIDARFAEGFTAEDFERVIDTKAAEWRGDPKMAAYLRPETLFGPKFEGYLNQPRGVAADDFSDYR